MNSEKLPFYLGKHWESRKNFHYMTNAFWIIFHTIKGCKHFKRIWDTYQRIWDTYHAKVPMELKADRLWTNYGQSNSTLGVLFK